MSKQKYYKDNEFLQTKEYNEIRNTGSNMNNVGESYIQERLNASGLVGYDSLVIENPKITSIMNTNGYLDFSAVYPVFAFTVPYIKVNYTDTSGTSIEQEFYNVRIQKENFTVSFTGVLEQNIEDKLSVYKIKTQNLYINISTDDTYQMTQVTENVPEYSSGTQEVKPLQYLVRNGQGIEFSLDISADAKIEHIVSFQEDGIPALNGFFNHSGYLYIAAGVTYTEHNIAPLMDVKEVIGLGGLTGVYTESEDGKLGEAIHELFKEGSADSAALATKLEALPNHALGFGDTLRGFGMLVNDLWTVISLLTTSVAGCLRKSNNLKDVANATESFNNIKQQATTTKTGVAKIATQAIVNAKTDNTSIVTSLTLNGRFDKYYTQITPVAVSTDVNLGSSVIEVDLVGLGLQDKSVIEFYTTQKVQTGSSGNECTIILSSGTRKVNFTFCQGNAGAGNSNTFSIVRTGTTISFFKSITGSLISAGFELYITGYYN